MSEMYSRDARVSGVGAYHRVLFVVNDLGFFLSHRLALALAARKAGYDVHVATAGGCDASLIENSDLEFHPLPITRSGTSIWGELRTFAAILKLHLKLRPDVAHHVTIKPVLYGGVAARLSRVPAVVSAVSGLGYLYIASGIKARLRRLFVDFAYRVALAHRNSRVIFQNPDDRQLFVGRGLVEPKTTTLIRGSGIDLDDFAAYPEQNGKPTVVLASRMLWDKGVGEFVDAASLLSDRGVEARFVLVGESDDGNPAAIPEQQLKEWRDSTTVEWWGYREDMSAVFRACHLACLPSYREGLPKVLIEAAASGRAIVATDVPGCREIVKNGVTGVLVPPQNSRALADAVETLLKDTELRRRMGEAGREYAESGFAIEHVVEQTLGVYQELLDERVRDGHRPHRRGAVPVSGAASKVEGLSLRSK
ncbi:MAG: glycosyltransferase family 4 protein [Gammaproteobacteria bacterium]